MACGLYDIKFHTRDETSKDEKQHDATDKSTSKQQVCISDGSRLRCAKNWTHASSASRPADESLCFKNYSTSNMFFRYFKASFSNDDYYKVGFLGTCFQEAILFLIN